MAAGWCDSGIFRGVVVGLVGRLVLQLQRQVLADHDRLLNQFAEQISSQRLLSTEQQLLQKVSQHIAVGIVAIDSQRLSCFAKACR